MSRRRAVFLDRDGTLIEERHYLGDPEGVFLLDGVSQALKLLSDAGFLLLMATNQSGVARGYFTMEDVHRVNDRVQSLLEQDGVQLDGAYICPHHPAGVQKKYAISCTCRKPEPGMAFDAAKDWGLDLSASYMIGDKPADISFGKNFGAQASYLVRTGYGAETGGTDGVTVNCLLDAALDILKRSQENP